MLKLQHMYIGAAAIAGAVIWNAPASAATVSCGGTGAGQRLFSVTLAGAATATCLASGPGNVNGNGDTVNGLSYVTIDASDNTTLYVGANGELTDSGIPSSSLSGSFSFAAPTGYNNFVYALKSGNGQLDPDWAAFLLPAGVTAGTWTISGANAYSHSILYGQACVDCPPGSGAGGEVPLPAALPLFGTILAGGGLIAWRRKRKAAKLAA